MWESGKANPESARLPAIAAACGVSLKIFFGDLPGDGKPKRKQAS